MPRFTVASFGLLFCVLALSATAPAVPPPLAAARFGLPEGALLGFAEDAARLTAAAPDGPGGEAAAQTAVEGSIPSTETHSGDDSGMLDDGLPVASDDEPEDLDDGLPEQPLPGEARATSPAASNMAAEAPPSSAAGSSREVLVPVRLDLPFIEHTIIEQLLDADGRVGFDIDVGGCNRLELSEPVVSFSPASASEPAGLRVRLLARARLGLPTFGRCTGMGDWNGQVEVLQTPHVLAGGGGFGLGVARSRVLDASGETSAAGVLWDWVKNVVQPRLGAVRVDLRGPLAELRDLLSQVLVRQTAEGLLSVLQSVRVTDAVAVEGGVELSLRMSAPAAVAAPAPAPLDALELARFRDAVADLDGFFTFVARTLAGPALGAQTRDALLAALIDGRYRLLEAIEAGEHGDEAVRALFVDLWDGLAPLLADLPGETPGEQGLRYLAFITAGDALRALDSLGPGTGLDISADGLRRLARLIAPGSEDDPLQRNDAVDEELRRRFGFGAPLPPPMPRPPAEPEVWFSPFEWLLPRARAEGAAAGAADSRLHGWAPGAGDLAEYLPLVRDLLDAVVAAERESGKLPGEVHALYRTLVLAIAWQESCWRQFVREAGVVTTLRSPAGALGLMQVSRQVWRGFYDVDGLAQDISYNARAGAEIARHYLVDYAMAAGEQRHAGGLDNLARAAYAAYNGGPRQLGRYRKANAPARLRAIDAAFLAKYEAVKSGDELAVASCFGAS